jgi:hypothetical protein
MKAIQSNIKIIKRLRPGTGRSDSIFRQSQAQRRAVRETVDKLSESQRAFKKSC